MSAEGFRSGILELTLTMAETMVSMTLAMAEMTLLMACPMAENIEPYEPFMSVSAEREEVGQPTMMKAWKLR